MAPIEDARTRYGSDFVNLMLAPRPSDKEQYRQSLQRRKRALLANPGKMLSELLPFMPKDSCDRMEADVRKQWDEVEI